MIKYPSIRQYKDIIRDVKQKVNYQGDDASGQPIYSHDAVMPKLRYRGTVKLHGTNASVVIRGTKVTPQSRNLEISLDKDNKGFARFALEEVKPEYWIRQAENIKEDFGLPEDSVISIFGELVGPGIVTGNTAISQVEKQFIIFSIKVGEGDDGNWLNISELEINHPKISNIHKYKFFDLEIDFENPALSTNTLVSITEEVEKQCPVGLALGVDGTGEGVVWKCMTPEFTDSKFWFKVKGREHSVTKVTTLASVDVEKIKSVDQFVDNVLTEQRFFQAIDYLKEQGQDVSIKTTGSFLEWLSNDIRKEESDTMEASMISEKDVGKVLSTKARVWYFNYLKKLNG